LRPLNESDQILFRAGQGLMKNKDGVGVKHTVKLSLLIMFIFLITIKSSASVYYVSLTGNDKNSGTSPTAKSANIGPWRTLTRAGLANANLRPGDTVNVQAGDYKNEQVVFSASGTAEHPIVFIGYKASPNDAPPVQVEMATATTLFNPLDMPTYTGDSRASGTAFNCRNQKYLVFKNFQIRNYGMGFLAGGTSQEAGSLILYNINIMTIGDVANTYAGQGFLLGSMGTNYSNNNSLTKCLVINAAAEGFGINGNYNTLTGCKVYCNENVNNAATDYYIIICGSYNTCRSCYVERAVGLSHVGHGIGAKTNAEQVVDQGLKLPAIAAQYNKFYNCEARNMGESFYVRHRTAQFNLFYHCKATGTHTGDAGSNAGEGNCMITRDGASSNTFDGCTAENCASGILFSDSIEDGGMTGHPGNDNIYMNCLIINCYIGVNFSDGNFPTDAGSNTIANCVFYKTRYLHYAGCHCANMKYIGNIYYGCLPSRPGSYFKGNKYAADIVPNGSATYFKNCDFINIESMPPGYSDIKGSLSIDPGFINAPDNFHLNTTSACINKIDTLLVPLRKTDFDGKASTIQTRSDIGAFEYSVCPTDVNQDGVTSSRDLGLVLSKCGTKCVCREDVNGDGMINDTDVNMILDRYGTSCK
jgi:hypothetical protein